jgi:hypothetical protein
VYACIHVLCVRACVKIYTVEPRFTNAPVHEQFGSRTNFPSKNVSDDERCLGLRTRKLETEASLLQRQAERIGAGVSVAG